MKHKLRVGVLMGGQSAEHEVSLASARSVIRALNKNKYEIVPVKIDRRGRWPKGLMVLPQPKQALFDLVIPMTHGTYGEDGKLQGLLELADIPYIGAGVLGSAVAMDKIVMKQLFESIGLPVVKYCFFSSQEWQENRRKIIKDIELKLKYPVFIKPANLGSSVGISKANNQNQLKRSVREAARYDRRIIIEAAVPAAKDIECSVLGNNQPKVSLPGRVIPADEFYSYRDKYVSGKTRFEIPANLPKSVIKKIRELAIKAFKILDLAGMARIDFLLDKNNKIFVNEANTIPGFNKISMYPKLWQVSGVSYEKLLDRLIELALERHREKNKLTSEFELGKLIKV